jgi:Protein of unknown function (DUF3455)
MRPMLSFTILALLITPAAAAELPDVIAGPDETLVTTTAAVGAQVYECERDSAGNLVWQFREPIATLLSSGKTVGRHYAGPNWEMIDGSVVSGKVIGRAAAASPNDVPLLRLEVVTRRGQGQLTVVTTIRRINTRGGVAKGSCDTPHALLGVPYTADYAFYRKRAAGATAGE